MYKLQLGWAGLLHACAGPGSSPHSEAPQDTSSHPSRCPPRRPQLSTALGGLVDYSDIQLGKYLGDGSFGSVHLARWKHVQVSAAQLACCAAPHAEP